MSDNINVSLADAHRVITELLPMGRPIVLVGAPGCGKTEVAIQAAAAAGFPVPTVGQSPYLFHPASAEPSDLSLPVITEEELTRKAWPEINQFLQPGEPRTLIVDDMGQASTPMQNALMPIFSEKRIGDLSLCSNVRLLATANALEHRAGSNKLHSALADRALFLYVEATVRDWQLHAIDRGIHDTIIGFCGFMPQYWNTFNAKEMHNPSARSWVAADAIVRSSLRDALRRAALAGLLGVETADNFMVYESQAAITRPVTAIRANPAAIDMPAEGALAHIETHALARTSTPGTAADDKTFLDRLGQAYGRDLVLVYRDLALSYAHQRGGSRERNRMLETNAFTAWVTEYQLVDRDIAAYSS